MDKEGKGGTPVPRGSSPTAEEYVVYFGFVDDVIFSYNGANGPESKTMRVFCPVRQVAETGGGSKSAVCDCMLFGCCLYTGRERSVLHVQIH